MPLINTTRKEIGMKVLYRPQRGSLDDAMAEVKEFSSVKEMLEYLVKDHNRAFRINEIQISYYGRDDRIDWETYLVAVERYFEEDYLLEYHCPQAIGFCTFKEGVQNETDKV